MAGKAYEDFQPATQVKDEDPENTILLLHLPGFEKEQISITYVHSSRIIRVEGQREVDGKWRRFNQVFQVPPNCKVDKIHARFHNALLTLTLPNQVPLPTSTQQQQQAPAILPRGPMTKESTKKSDDHMQMQPKEAVVNEEIKAAKAKQEEETKTTTAKEKQQLECKNKEKQTSLQQPSDKSKQQHLVDHAVKKVDQEQPAAEHCKLPKRPRDMAAAVKKGLMGLEGKDDRQLLLNVGVALVVIVAIGAYATYKIRSKSKE